MKILFYCIQTHIIHIIAFYPIKQNYIPKPGVRGDRVNSPELLGDARIRPPVRRAGGPARARRWRGARRLRCRQRRRPAPEAPRRAPSSASRVLSSEPSVACFFISGFSKSIMLIWVSRIQIKELLKYSVFHYISCVLC